ncbi:hypothetical protein EJC47_05545 [Sphingomonas sp. TF3]|uniref:hypothetical protein n=2 Tax=Pseudomonadota TaxID=1224 RepID=UPI000F88E8E1|nr:hypothetical protein [Sphingomonas sp. TF3]RUN77399.1 hypothetical protein EJC47_05545 [Sphingomonas sp. TF3]
MKLLISLLVLMFGAAEVWSAPPARRSGVSVPPGKFQLWFPSQKYWDFRSAGLRVSIAPLPCDAAHPSEGCRFQGLNNQALVTITAKGMERFQVETDNQSAWYRLAVVQIDRRDRLPGVIIENNSGGSAGSLVLYAIKPVGHRFQRVVLEQRANGVAQPWLLEGDIADDPQDLSRDGVIDIVARDGQFAFAFGCNACTPRPPVIFTIRNGQGIDMSRDPAFAPIFRRDMKQNAAGCRNRRQRYRNGACAAYAADAARLGLYAQAAVNVARWYNPDGDEGADFPKVLHAFLVKAGYLP